MMRFLRVSALCGIAMMAVALSSATASAQEAIRWGSGSLGSSAQILISAIISVVNSKQKDMVISDQITAGTNENLALLQNKNIEIGQSGTREAWVAATGAKGAKWNIPDMMFLFTLYPSAISVVVREESDIKSIEGLVGKRVSLGPPGSGIAGVWPELLEHGYGMPLTKLKALYLGYPEGAEALRNGQIDATTFNMVVNTPAPYVQQLDVSTKVRFVGISREAWTKMRKKYAYYDFDALTVSPGSLKNLKEEIFAIPFFSTEYTDSRMSEERAYNLVKTIYENTGAIKRYTALAEGLTPKLAMAGALPTVAVHPGAARYYKEIGVWRNDLTVGQVKR